MPDYDRQQEPSSEAQEVARRDEELRTWLHVPSPSRDFNPFWSEDWSLPGEEQVPDHEGGPWGRRMHPGTIPGDPFGMADFAADPGGETSGRSQRGRRYNKPSQPAE
jgi:hypothetical protein